MEVNRKAWSTIKNTRIALEGLEKFKPLDKVTKSDLIKYFRFIGPNYSENTFVMKKRIIKKFYKDNGKVDMVDWIEIKYPKNNLDPDEILTTDDVNTLIEASNLPMYKALISFLFESGARLSEALSLKVADIQEKEQGLLVSVKNIKTEDSSKMKYRKQMLFYSNSYIQNWVKFGKLKKTDNLFPVSQSGICKYFWRLKEKAGITKPVTPHKFRHAQATDMVRRGYQELIIRKKLGWTLDSKMISRYVHLIDDDVVNAQLRMEGLSIAKEELTDIVKAEPLSELDLTGILHQQKAEIDDLKSQQSETLEILKKMILEKWDKENEEIRKFKDVERHPEMYDLEDIKPEYIPESDNSMKEIKKLVKQSKKPIKKYIK